MLGGGKDFFFFGCRVALLILILCSVSSLYTFLHLVSVSHINMHFVLITRRAIFPICLTFPLCLSVFVPQPTTRTTPKGILLKPPQPLDLRSSCGEVLSLRPRPRPKPRPRARARARARPSPSPNHKPTRRLNCKSSLSPSLPEITPSAVSAAVFTLDDGRNKKALNLTKQKEAKFVYPLNIPQSKPTSLVFVTRL